MLSLQKSDADWPAGAVWNFPSGLKGRVRLRMLLKPGFAGARIGITDHFSVPFDDLDQFHNLFNLPIASDGSIAPEAKLPIGKWFDLECNWNCETRECVVMVDGKQGATLPQNRDTLGASYLRLISTASTTDQAGLLVESVQADVKPKQ